MQEEDDLCFLEKKYTFKTKLSTWNYESYT